MASLRDSNPTTSNAEMIPSGSPANTNPLVIPSSEIVCEHGRLDPLKAQDMKCLSQVRPSLYTTYYTLSADEIVQDSFSMILNTGCTFEPILKMSDPCDVCIASLFRGTSNLLLLLSLN